MNRTKTEPTYECLTEALRIGPTALMNEWRDIVDRISRPGNRPDWADGGHIPHGEVHDVLNNCNSPGIYVWGAWTGPNARLQYIGRCGGPIRDRFETQRYFDEWRRADTYGLKLRHLPESFSRKEPPKTREQRYIDSGIPEFEVTGRGSGRLQRAERYAKIGLSNLWYYFLPTDDPTGCPELEKHLIQASSALLFQQWEAGYRRAFPLLNKSCVGLGSRREPNPHAPANAAAYDKWLDGEWWAGASWADGELIH